MLARLIASDNLMPTKNETGEFVLESTWAEFNPIYKLLSSGKLRYDKSNSREIFEIADYYQISLPEEWQINHRIQQAQVTDLTDVTFDVHELVVSIISILPEMIAKMT